jgi:hypothetical protein
MYREEGASDTYAVDNTAVFANQNASNNDTNFEELEFEKVSSPEIKQIPNKGKVLITATNGAQESLFDKDVKKSGLHREPLQNSFFTYYLTKGLEKYKGQIFNAFDYAKVRTSKLVARDYPEGIKRPK